MCVCVKCLYMLSLHVFLEMIHQKKEYEQEAEIATKTLETNCITNLCPSGQIQALE